MAEKILKSRNFVNVGIWILLVFDISMKYNIFTDVFFYFDDSNG